MDAYGDPLPPGALLRLGTVRYRDGLLAAVAPSPDGRVLALASTLDGIRLLDVATGKELRRFRVDRHQIDFLAYSPDGKSLALTDDELVQLWDVASGKKLLELKSSVAGLSLGPPAFSADGRVLAAGNRSFLDEEGGPAHVWDVATGRLLGAFSPVHKTDVRVALAPDGQTLAAWGEATPRVPKVLGDLLEPEGEAEPAAKPRPGVQLWDVRTGRELRRLAWEGEPVTIAFSPDGKTVVVAADAGVKLSAFEAATGKLVRRFAGLRGLDAFLAFSPDGKLLAAGGEGGAVVLWEVATGRRLAVAEGPRGKHPTPVFAPDGRVLVGQEEGQSANLWKVSTGRSLGPTGEYRTPVEALAFTADGKALLSAGTDRVVCRWDLATARPTRRMALKGQGSASLEFLYIASTCWLSPDGRHAVYATDQDGFRLWDLATGRVVCDFESRHTFPGIGMAVAFSPDGQRLALGGRGVRVWDVGTGRELLRLKGPDGEIYCLAFSPDGRTLAAGGGPEGRLGTGGYELILWDANGKERRRLQKKDMPLRDLAFSPDGRTLAVASQKQRVWLLDVATGEEAGQLAGGGEFFTSPLAFSPDGRLLAAEVRGENGGEARVVVWEVLSGQVRREFTGQGGFVTSLAFSPDGRTLAAGCTDTTVLLWDVATPAHGQPDPGGRLTAKDLQGLWNDLGAADAAKAHAALMRLAASSEDAVPFLAGQLRPAGDGKADAAALRRWVAELQHDDFAVREKAERGLAAAGKTAEPVLRKALEDRPPADARRRLEQLLERLDDARPSREVLRLVRVVEALERAGSREARRLLEALARGEPGERLTREAKFALERLARHTAAAP